MNLPRPREVLRVSVPVSPPRCLTVCLPACLLFRQITVAIAIIIGVVLYRLSVLASLAYWKDDYVSSYAMLFTNATAATINLVIVLLLNQVRLRSGGGLCPGAVTYGWSSLNAMGQWFDMMWLICQAYHDCIRVWWAGDKELAIGGRKGR